MFVLQALVPLTQTTHTHTSPCWTPGLGCHRGACYRRNLSSRSKGDFSQHPSPLVPASQKSLWEQAALVWHGRPLEDTAL